MPNQTGSNLGSSVVRASEADSPFGRETLATSGPDESRATLTVQDLYRRNQAAWDQNPDDMFPSFGTGVFVYSRDLMGEAFRFVSGTETVILPEKTLPSGGKIGEQEAVRVWVQRWDWEAHTWRTAILASLTDAYLVGQLRDTSADVLIDSGLWTIARNPKFSTAGGDAPRMLKRYEYGVDAPINEVRYQAVKAAKRGAIPAAQTHADTSELFGGRVPSDWTGPNGKPSQREQEQAEIARVQGLANADAGTPPWFSGSKAKPDPREMVEDSDVDQYQETAPVKRGPGRPKGSGKKS